MKILCLSDLHRNFFGDKDKIQSQNAWVKSLIDENKPDVIVITGDIHESNSQHKIYEDLSELTCGITTICTLGNHEFYHSTVKDTLNKYERKANSIMYDVHFLDVVDWFTYEDKNKKKYAFFGNWLGYDGSMSTVPNQNLYDWAYSDIDHKYHWADKLILDYNYLKTCKDNIAKIKKSYKKFAKMDCIKILCTHSVPHRKLNGWMSESRNEIVDKYNAYSGVDNLLGKMKIDYSISGHTHYRIVGTEINGCKCINVGSDYPIGKHKYYILEI